MLCGYFWSVWPEADTLYVPRREQALVVISPVAAVYKAQAGMAVKGAERPAACGGLPLTDGPACATPCGAAGDISSKAAPFPWIGKGGGGIGLTVSHGAMLYR